MASKEDVSPAQWALDLFEPTAEDYQTNWSHYWPLGNGAIIGAGGVLLRNFMLNRPLYSGIHLTVFYGIAGVFCAAGIMYVVEISKARRDAMLRDYIRHYPHRFPEPRNQKYADILQPWEPHR
ncbi:hypothetical protein ANTPLA_LOCUS4112 [Anthophora plagiata]